MYIINNKSAPVIQNRDNVFSLDIRFQGVKTLVLTKGGILGYYSYGSNYLYIEKERQKERMQVRVKKRVFPILSGVYQFPFWKKSTQQKYDRRVLSYGQS